MGGQMVTRGLYQQAASAMCCTGRRLEESEAQGSGQRCGSGSGSSSSRKSSMLQSLLKTMPGTGPSQEEEEEKEQEQEQQQGQQQQGQQQQGQHQQQQQQLLQQHPPLEPAPVMSDATVVQVQQQRRESRELLNGAPAARSWGHLVLHFDVNKTVVMRDSISKKSVDDIVNEVLADAAWGLEVDGQWALTALVPSVTRPPSKGGSQLISYAEYLERHVPDKKSRSKQQSCFTMEGQPGYAFSDHAKRLRAGLRTADGTDVRVINAFFELLVFLKRQKRSFCIVFRTFGEDLGEVAEEVNKFCEGRHPAFPDARFDGSDGEPDYRIPKEDYTRMGTFHRDDEALSLVMGTWEQPGEGKYKDVENRSASFYKDWPNAKVISGHAEVADYVEEMTSKPGSIGLRDYFQFWKRHGRTSKGGKVLFVDKRMSSKTHSVFFDDNIRFNDAFIVQPLCRVELNRQLMTLPLLQTHLCRAEPLESIPDPLYFVKQLRRLEDNFERSRRAQQRLRHFAKRIRLQQTAVSQLLKDYRVKGSQECDAWEALRHDENELSMAHVKTLDADE
eukprot:CAMPEP_0206427692 /NCGR_PEP_ID=MMETSP0324_2-20121206/5194_1 /ASSEMBLY_ACC=CAM_ASM_000836 /TAXON_ID=2866 /ORGANISM="Crypthecodinium cohnii, Strain Seligo" /LENGTH=558 /DNA_ID=CAMNT_0053893025 /DNA_START=217 /DNA_END=1893 /DNA_ORIENTATION=+